MKKSAVHMAWILWAMALCAGCPGGGSGGSDGDGGVEEEDDDDEDDDSEEDVDPSLDSGLPPDEPDEPQFPRVIAVAGPLILLETGEVYNVYGASPTKIEMPPATAISEGGFCQCAIHFDGTVSCWGPEEPFQSDVPTLVAGITDARQIACSFGGACVVDSAGQVLCWGNPAVIADGTDRTGMGYYLTPTAPVGLGKVVDIAVAIDHACAVTEDGLVKCWGEGNLGNGTYDEESFVPITVEGISDAKRVSGISQATCVVLGNGGVKCWGPSGVSRFEDFTADTSVLGDGTDEDRWSPVDVIGAADVIDVDLSGKHACAVTRSGDVLCWGEGSLGALGNGDADQATALPVASDETWSLATTGSSGFSVFVNQDGVAFRTGRFFVDQDYTPTTLDLYGAVESIDPCVAPYRGQITDPQADTLCRAAYLHECSMRTTEQTVTCSILEELAAADSCPHCPQ